MTKTYNPYIKQAIELAEEAKKQLVVPKELIESIHDNRELGIKIRELYNEKVRECEHHINYMKALENRGLE